MTTLRFNGTVFSGLGKGAYYVGHPGFRERFQKTLGYTPYPGTLNLRLTDKTQAEARSGLGRNPAWSIAAFDYGGQNFSAVKCYDGRMSTELVTLTIPQITEYDDTVLEIIAPVRLRDALRLADGQGVEVLLEDRLVLGIDADRDRVIVP